MIETIGGISVDHDVVANLHPRDVNVSSIMRKEISRWNPGINFRCQGEFIDAETIFLYAPNLNLLEVEKNSVKLKQQ